MKNIALLGLLAMIPAFSQQPKFELADVHTSPTPRWFVENYEPNNEGQIRDGRYVFRNASLQRLIESAYGVTNDMVAGGPGWLKMDIYDVVGKIPAGTTPETGKLMLQSLLAERFGLVAKRDTRPLPRFVLSVSKGGSKWKPAAPVAKPEDSGCRPQAAGPMPTGGAISPAQFPNTKVICRSVTSQLFIENLRQIAGGPINTYIPREVFDSTGLEGKWDFEFEFTPIGIVGDKGADGITLFDALSKQSGMNLELKDVAVPALVIEKVNRRPTANAAAVKTDLALGIAQFEVASIKPIDPNERRPIANRSYSEVKLMGSLKTLITQAFLITPNSANDVIIGLPKSAESQFWEITAKLPSTGEGAPGGTTARPIPPTRSVLAEMVRGLLAEQFGLKTHTENRKVTVYAMTLRGKPKMTQAKGTERAECPADPLAVKPYPNMGTMVSCTNMTMPDFAENLNQATGFFDHPIVDATGLKGGWNFKIGWSRVTQGPPNPNEPVGMTSYEAVERQMGVKLVKQQRSIPVIVVDHVEEKPLE